MISKDRYISFDFIGTKVQCLSYRDLYDFVESWFQSNKSVHIAVINAYCTVMAKKNPKLSKIYSESDLSGPDGMPFVHWMSFFSKKKVNQFDATNVLIKLIEFSKIFKYGFYFYGAEQKVLKTMVQNLKNKYNYINISGYYSPPFRDLSVEEKEEIINKIIASKARVVCVGLGTPKQDYWISEHKSKLPGVLFLPCGAIFDFFGGRIKKAPGWISYIGFEWLFRLFSKDFSRLFYRYTILNIYFLFHFFIQRIKFIFNNK